VKNEHPFWKKSFKKNKKKGLEGFIYKLYKENG
jgi:hypothetical protein